MKLLISIKGVDEASIALEGGADIIDVKEPLEGSLGAANPRVLSEVVEVVGGRAEVSAAAGDLQDAPNLASCAALTLASLGAGYVKLGLHKVGSVQSGVKLVESVKQCLGAFGFDPKVAVVGYADYVRSGSLSPSQVLRVAMKSLADVFMLDTYIKDGKSSLSFVSLEQLARLFKQAHDGGLTVALAGSLSLSDVERVKPVEPDILGFRGAACAGGRSGGLSLSRVRELRRAVKGG